MYFYLNTANQVVTLLRPCTIFVANSLSLSRCHAEWPFAGTDFLSFRWMKNMQISLTKPSHVLILPVQVQASLICLKEGFDTLRSGKVSIFNGGYLNVASIMDQCRMNRRLDYRKCVWLRPTNHHHHRKGHKGVAKTNPPSRFTRYAWVFPE